MSIMAMKSSQIALKPARMLVSTYSAYLRTNRILLDDPTKLFSLGIFSSVKQWVWNVGLGADCGSFENLSLMTGCSQEATFTL